MTKNYIISNNINTIKIMENFNCHPLRRHDKWKNIIELEMTTNILINFDLVV